MKPLLIEINKLVGETGTLRDEATIEHIISNSKNIAKDIATKHPFIDGNKRTAYITFKMIEWNAKEKYYKNGWVKDHLIPQLVIQHTIWLDILKDC